MTRIAFLGWGSLLWEDRPEFDCLHEDWKNDGPLLSLEFSRVSSSRDGALTLVIDPKYGSPTSVAWCLSKRNDPKDAVSDLRWREGCAIRRIARIDLPLTKNGTPTWEGSAAIAEWAKSRELDVVIWTALESNFEDKVKKPFSINEAIAYLKQLPRPVKVRAAEYLWRAPEFVRTKLRTALEKESWFSEVDIIRKIISRTQVSDYTSDCHKLVMEFVGKYASRWSKGQVEYITSVFEKMYHPGGWGVLGDDVIDDLQRPVSECLNQISLLQQLLAIKGWQLSDEEIFHLVQHETREMRINEGKQRILRSNPIGRDELLRAYLHISNSDNELMMESLSRILREKNLGFSPSVSLKTEIIELERSIELQAFEKNLLRDASVLPPQIDSMSGRDFEVFIATLFQKMGFHVVQTKLTGDQGADVLVSKRGEKIAIQAKRSAASVGNRAVQEVMGSVSLYKALRGIVITNNSFTRSAVELATANKIELIDKTRLHELIQIYW